MRADIARDGVKVRARQAARAMPAAVPSGAGALLGLRVRRPGSPDRNILANAR